MFIFISIFAIFFSLQNTNTIPPTYCLQNTTEGSLDDTPQQQSQLKPSYQKWLAQTKQVHDLLTRAAKVALEKELMPEEIANKYILSGDF